MTLIELNTLLKTVGCPVAYHHFLEAQEPPFLVYASDNEEDFKADNTSYAEIKQGYIELYSRKKDFSTEAAVKAALKVTNKLAFRKENEDYIESEKLFYVRWSFSMI